MQKLTSLDSHMQNENLNNENRKNPLESPSKKGLPVKRRMQHISQEAVKKLSFLPEIQLKYASFKIDLSSDDSSGNEEALKAISEERLKKIQEISEKLNISKTENANLKDELDRKTSEFNQQEILNKKRQEDLEKEVEELKNANQALSNQSNSFSEVIASLKKENKATIIDLLTDQLAKIEEIENLQSKIEKLKKENSKNCTPPRFVSDTNQTLLFNKQIELKQKSIDELVSASNQKDSELLSMKKNVELLRDSFFREKAKNAALTTEIKKLENAIGKLELEIFNLKKAVQDKNQEMARLKYNHMNQIANNAQKIKDLLEKNEDLIRTTNLLTNSNELLADECQKYQHTNTDLLNLINEQKNNLNLKNTINESSQRQIEGLIAEMTNKDQKIENLLEKNANLNESNQLLIKSNELLTSECQKYHYENTFLLNLINEQKKDLDSHNIINESNQHQIEDLNAQVNQKNQIINYYLEELSTVKNKIQELENLINVQNSNHNKEKKYLKTLLAKQKSESTNGNSKTKKIPDHFFNHFVLEN